MITTLPATIQRPLSCYERPINGHCVSFHISHSATNGTTTVIAKLHDNCTLDVLNDFEDNQSTSFLVLAWDKRLAKCHMSPHPMARATCDPRDTFDEEYGKRLAYDRLKVAYWSQYEDRLGKLNEVLMDVFNLNSDRMTKISEMYLQGEA